ncbi:MAG: PHP domain-containing protein [Ruminococcaceae bacterium]|nr:PHP domain-containing protein [Oscillospiraceae bacterium]
MNYNYHTHTFRCNHASGTPEEYVKRATGNGIKYMGFSEHFPYICRDGYEARYRLPTSQIGDYFREIGDLREKYKNEIDIKIGFEMEYYHGLFDTMLENAVKYGAEYLILGPHFIDEEHPGGVYAMTLTENEADYVKYADCVVDGIKSNVFTYVAHPDLFNYVGNEEIYKREAERICRASLEYGVPLEINFLGIRTGRNYPNEAFWEVAGRIGSPVTFGFDAHDAMSSYDGESLKKAEKLVEKYGLNYIGCPKIILLKDIIK